MSDDGNSCVKSVIHSTVEVITEELKFSRGAAEKEEVKRDHQPEPSSSNNEPKTGFVDLLTEEFDLFVAPTVESSSEPEVVQQQQPPPPPPKQVVVETKKTTRPASSSAHAVFPNIFLEVLEHLIPSIMIFTLADLRHLARAQKEKLVAGDSILQLPQSGEDMFDTVLANRDLIQAKFKSNHSSTLNMIFNNFPERRGQSVIIHHLGDDNALHECVHGLHVHMERKEVVLTFRGSITVQDWITDAKLVCGTMENPACSFFDNDDDDDDMPETIGVHAGFRDYLYADPPSKSTTAVLPLAPSALRSFLLESVERYTSANDTATGSSREEENDDLFSTAEPDEEPIPRKKIYIIFDQVQQLMDAHPGYTLALCGHSLGGALALLASLEAAARFAKPKFPVTCITIGSPRVGDADFLAAVQSLERKGKLRVLAVTNRYDLVPLTPNRFCRCDVCRPNEWCQPGMVLSLSRTSYSKHYHPKRNDTKWEEIQRELHRLAIMVACCSRVAQQHNYKTYMQRLIQYKEPLSKLYLNDLYAGQDIRFV